MGPNSASSAHPKVKALERTWFFTDIIPGSSLALGISRCRSKGPGPLRLRGEHPLCLDTFEAALALILRKGEEYGSIAVSRGSHGGK